MVEGGMRACASQPPPPHHLFIVPVRVTHTDDVAARTLGTHPHTNRPQTPPTTAGEPEGLGAGARVAHAPSAQPDAAQRGQALHLTVPHVAPVAPQHAEGHGGALAGTHGQRGVGGRRGLGGVPCRGLGCMVARQCQQRAAGPAAVQEAGRAARGVAQGGQPGRQGARQGAGVDPHATPAPHAFDGVEAGQRRLEGKEGERPVLEPGGAGPQTVRLCFVGVGRGGGWETGGCNGVTLRQEDESDST